MRVSPAPRCAGQLEPLVLGAGILVPQSVFALGQLSLAHVCSLMTSLRTVQDF